MGQHFCVKEKENQNGFVSFYHILEKLLDIYLLLSSLMIKIGVAHVLGYDCNRQSSGAYSHIIG